ncbi:MAG: hypothetical protein R3C01_01635 [Planctomycetaceae bacterium]
MTVALPSAPPAEASPFDPFEAYESPARRETTSRHETTTTLPEQLSRLPASAPANLVAPEESAWTREQALLRLREAGVRVSFDEAGNVASIDGRDTQFTDNDLRLLSAFPELKQLNLRGTTISPGGVAVLSRMYKLEFLGLGQTSFSDRDVLALQSLTQLRYLSLADTRITDEALAHLMIMHHLEGLNLKGTRVTPQGVASLRSKLSKCRVVSDAGIVRAESLFEETVQSPLSSDFPYRIDGYDDEIATVGYAPRSSSSSVSASPDGSAEERLRKALLSKLEDPDVQLALADVDAEKGEWESAYMVYRRLSDAAPDNRAIRFRLGQAMAALGDLEGARREFVLAVGPAGSHYQIARQHFEARRLFDCRRELKESLLWDSEYAPARKLMIDVSRQIENNPEYGDANESDSFGRENATIERLIQALQGGSGAKSGGGGPSEGYTSRPEPVRRPEWQVEISPQPRDHQRENDNRSAETSGDQSREGTGSVWGPGPPSTYRPYSERRSDQRTYESVPPYTPPTEYRYPNSPRGNW